MRQRQRLLRRYWHFVLVAVVGILFAVLGSGGGDAPAPAPRPQGWTVASEPGSVLAIAFLDGDVWVGSKTGLHRVDAATGNYLGRVDAGTEVAHVRALLADTSGTLWVGHLNGLTRYHAGQTATFTVADGLPDNRVNALAQNHNGRVWIGTANGLAFIENGKIAMAPETTRLLSPIVNSIVENKDGELWVASTSTPSGGVTLLNGPDTETFTPVRGLPHPYVNQLLVDHGGAVWAATGQLEEGGACQFRRDAKGWGVSATISRADGLPGAKVRSIFEDADGDLWMGFENDGLALRTGRGIVAFNESDGLPHKEVTCIAGGPDGEIWLGTLAGVLRIEPGAARRMKHN
jgi:ligand-binding sensor domain-containing protein